MARQREALSSCMREVSEQHSVDRGDVTPGASPRRRSAHKDGMMQWVSRTPSRTPSPMTRNYRNLQGMKSWDIEDRQIEDLKTKLRVAIQASTDGHGAVTPRGHLFDPPTKERPQWVSRTPSCMSYPPSNQCCRSSSTSPESAASQAKQVDVTLSLDSLVPPEDRRIVPKPDATALPPGNWGKCVSRVPAHPPPVPHSAPRRSPIGFSPVTSAGSVGHPFTCAEACKYAKKTRGCKDGAACNRCHHCEWVRHAKDKNQQRRRS
mmetsp:Transcript_107768/g.311384  ORF Transcript_107768/g.311384 Transcript_107768/m.311384 type:complete len:263 (-) Transcript_107768:337-1125(-)